MATSGGTILTDRTPPRSAEHPSDGQRTVSVGTGKPYTAPWTDEGTVGLRPLGPFVVPFVADSVEEDVTLGLEALAELAEAKADLRRRIEAALP